MSAVNAASFVVIAPHPCVPVGSVYLSGIA